MEVAQVVWGLGTASVNRPSLITQLVNRDLQRIWVNVSGMVTAHLMG